MLSAPYPQLLNSTNPAAPHCACSSPSELTLLGLRRVRSRSRLPRGQRPRPSQGNFRPCLLSSLFLDPLQSGLCAPQQPSGKPPASLRCQINHAPVSYKPGAGATLYPGLRISQIPCTGQRGGVSWTEACRGESAPAERSSVGTRPAGLTGFSQEPLAC